MSASLGIPMQDEPDALVRERASASPGGRTKTTRRGEGIPPRSTGSPISVPLAELQRWFAAVMTHPEDVGLAVATCPAPFSPSDVDRVVLPSAQLSSTERIEIYHGAYRARLVECLADDYPTLQHVLGEESFETLCRGYIAAHPSRGPSLNFFGRHMAAFCRTEAHPQATFLSDLAALEWGMVEVLHAPQAPPISLAELERIPRDRWGGARLEAGEALRLFEFSYPVNAFLQSVRSGGAPPIPEPGWSSAVVYRDGALIWRMNLDRAMAALLGGLCAGDTLARALDRMTQVPDFTEARAPEVLAWFRDWIGHGLFRSIAID